MPTRLWGRATPESEVDLFTACDLGAARRHASRQLFGRFQAEPFERLDLELIPCGGTCRPVEYTLTVFGHDVRWSLDGESTRFPEPSPPGHPPAAEALMPIPEYNRTCAVAETVSEVARAGSRCQADRS